MRRGVAAEDAGDRLSSAWSCHPADEFRLDLPASSPHCPLRSITHANPSYPTDPPPVFALIPAEELVAARAEARLDAGLRQTNTRSITAEFLRYAIFAR